MAKTHAGQASGALARQGEGRPATGSGKTALKHAAKKHAAEKHAAKKHAAKKFAAKHTPEEHAVKQAAKHAAKDAARKHAAKKMASALDTAVYDDTEQAASEELAQAFHHLHRAGAIISLLETDTGQDLRKMLEDGIALYRRAAENASDGNIARCAAGLLRAAEHLGMAGLYAARGGYRVQVEAPSRTLIEQHLARVQKKFEAMKEPGRGNGKRLLAMARELLRRAREAGDPHLEFEFTMAADGLCTALEYGV